MTRHFNLKPRFKNNSRRWTLQIKIRSCIIRITTLRRKIRLRPVNLEYSRSRSLGNVKLTGKLKWRVTKVGWCLVARITGVELGEDGRGDTLEHLLGEDTEQLPADVEGLEYCAVLVVTLRRRTTYLF